MNSSSLKPCLVPARRGFCVLYKERFLYSKYDPQKPVLDLINSLTILADSLILIFSPCLWLGIEELLSKIPKNCRIFAIEDEEELFNFSKSLLKEKKLEHKITLVNTKEFFVQLSGISFYKRVIPIDFSGGVFFHKDEYQKAFVDSRNVINSFWKNRVTLVKFGRLYSKNFFRNLKKNPAQFSIPAHNQIFSRPIIVFGAGESLYNFLKSNLISVLEKFTVIAVDAALPVLHAFNVKQDFVVCQEAQLAIEKNYIGCKTLSTGIFDLASRPQVMNHFKGKKLFFSTNYADSSFFDKMKELNILPQEIPPLGSVGLSAIFISLVLRKNQNVPVLFCGLDFSFSLGKTHSNETSAHKTRLCNTTRLFSIENYEASFKTGAEKIIGKNQFVYTDQTLKNYAEIFSSFFKGTENLFDVSEFGLNLSIPFIKSDEIKKLAERYEKKCQNEYEILFDMELSDSIQEKTVQFLNEEKEALLRLKNLLSNGENAIPKPNPNLQTEVAELLKTREYLYLHFPDGYKKDFTSISFLKRIRNEIDFFLKNF